MEAMHYYGPWVLLLSGVVGLIQTCFFYRRVIDFTIRLYESPKFDELFRQDQRMETMRTLVVRMLNSPFLYWFSTIWALLLIVASAVWFTFRPT